MAAVSPLDNIDARRLSTLERHALGACIADDGEVGNLRGITQIGCTGIPAAPLMLKDLIQATPSCCAPLKSVLRA